VSRARSPEPHMLNPAAKCVSAVFASILAGACLMTLSHSPASAAEDCLSSPKREGTPAGSHWYYRVDRATKRHCWFLREVGEIPPRVRAPSSRSARQISSQPETGTQHSVSDARAELPAQQSFERPTGGFPSIPMMQADAAPTGSSGGRSPGAEASQSVIASRWPEPSGVSSPFTPAPAAEKLAANVQTTSQAAPPPPVASAPLGAEQNPEASFPVLLSVIAGALVLAGLILTALLGLHGTRRPSTRLHIGRDNVREPTDDDRIVLSDDPDPILPRPSRFARDVDRPGKANGRIEEFLSYFSGRAAT
jgi:hypothetical protein